MPLTHTQQAVYNSIVTYMQTHHYAPSFREIGKLTGITSTGHLYYHLQGLKDKGYLTYEYKTARSIMLLHPPPEMKTTYLEELSTIRMALQRMQVPEESIQDIVNYIKTYFL